MSQTEYAAAQAVNATPDMAVSERLLGVVAALVDKQGIDKRPLRSWNKCWRQSAKS